MKPEVFQQFIYCYVIVIFIAANIRDKNSLNSCNECEAFPCDELEEWAESSDKYKSALQNLIMIEPVLEKGEKKRACSLCGCRRKK